MAATTSPTSASSCGACSRSRLTRACRWSPIPATPAAAASASIRWAPTCALFRQPATEDEISHIAEPINVPDPLRSALMALAACGAGSTVPAPKRRADDDYGAGRQRGAARARRGSARLPPLADRRARSASATCATCSTLAATSSAGPRGRRRADADRASTPSAAACCSARASRRPARSRPFHYGFARDIGGGEYERTPAGDAAGDAAQRGGSAGAAAASRRDRRPAAGC